MAEDEQVKEDESQETPTKESSEDKLSAYQAKADKALAAANKEASAAKKEAEALKAELSETKGYIAILKERGELSDDEEKKAQFLSKRESELKARMETVSKAERQATLRILASDFPDVPSEVYDSLDDASAMELAALRYERAHPKQPSAPKETERPKQRQESKGDDEDGVEPARVDTGSGNGLSRFDYSSLDLSTPEGRKKLDEHNARLRKAAERMRGR